MKGIKKIVLIIVTLVISVTVIGKIYNQYFRKDTLSPQIYSKLQQRDYRLTMYSNAIKLNNGKSANTCVFFVSEVLRSNSVKIPYGTCNTTELLNDLKKLGWRKSTDYTRLKPGNICFTTDASGNKNGIPTHTYIFMKWVKQGNYDNAYICDNQAKDYNGKIYHIRNVKNSVIKSNNGKDAFSFFMIP
ncbi:hypothetical protein [Clostridium oryzae]|uniref:Bacteriophage peptidoglycan hydrolase n=1 Tax=Clostridium oryzae TaxID=1450648 RepID=A0A1V4IUP9_9CLOT|nr:hypothetical protein [Clostridium oryzae]OPJ63550.1 hypothetical protein CLORY_10580 [Clostridium oryzae]